MFCGNTALRIPVLEWETFVKPRKPSKWWVGGQKGRWHRLAALLLSVYPRASVAPIIAYHHQVSVNKYCNIKRLSVQKSTIWNVFVISDKSAPKYAGIRTNHIHSPVMCISLNKIGLLVWLSRFYITFFRTLCYLLMRFKSSDLTVHLFSV